MLKLRTVMITLAAMGLATPLLASQPQSSVRDLQTARQHVARAADKTDGQMRQALLDEQRRIDDMIEQLEGGELGRTTRSGPPSVR